MSFWQKFGKIAGIAGAGAATLATMGAASPALAGALGAAGLGGKVLSGVGKAGDLIGKVGDVAGSLSPVIGNLAAGRAAGRQQETGNILGYGQLQQGHDSQLNTALMQEFANQMGLVDTRANLLERRTAQAKAGDLQANVQDVRIPDSGRVHVQHWEGGVRPSAMGPNAREAGRIMSDTALGALRNGEDLPTAPNLSGNISAMPKLPQGNVLDSILGAAGPALGIAGAIAPYLGGGNSRTPAGQPSGGSPNLSPGDVAYGKNQSPNLYLPSTSGPGPAGMIPGQGVTAPSPLSVGRGQTPSAAASGRSSGFFNNPMPPMPSHAPGQPVNRGDPVNLDDLPIWEYLY